MEPMEVALPPNLADCVTGISHLYNKMREVEAKRIELEALHLAISSGDVPLVKEKIRKGVVMNARDANGNTCLHLAAATSSTYLVNMFLCDASINATNSKKQTPLHMAARRKRYAIVKFLLKHGAEVNAQDTLGLTPLHEAVKNGAKYIVNLLLKHGADHRLLSNDGNSVLHFGVSMLRNSDFLLDLELKVNLKNAKGKTALHLAAKFCEANVVEKLIQMGADVNALTNKDKSAMHLAVKRNPHGENNMLEIMRLLVDHGANATRLLDHKDLSVLYKAAKLGYSKIIAYLLELDPELATDECHDHIVFAAIEAESCLESVSLLVRHGARVDVENEEGENTLHVAIKNMWGEVGCCRQLLSVGKIDIEARNKDGDTALHMAARKAHDRVFDLLIEHGANMTTLNKKLESPLHVALKAKSNYISRSLIIAGVDLNGIDLFGLTPLLLAIKDEDEDMVRDLLSYGANGNDEDVLIQAAKSETVDMMKLLLTNGVKIDHDSVLGHEIFVSAINHARFKMVLLLLHVGANINFRYNEMLPIDHAYKLRMANHRHGFFLMLIMAREVARQLALDKTVDKGNVEVIQSDPPVHAMYLSSIAELEEMKKTRICENYSVTYFDLMAKRNNALVNCLRQTVVRDALAERKYHQTFKHYSHDLDVMRLWGMCRLNNMTKFEAVLTDIFKNLPHVVIREIAQLYNDDDFGECIEGHREEST